MIHYNLDTITKESIKAYEEMNKGRMEDRLGRLAFMLGYLQQAYKSAYNDLPDEKKQMQYLEKKYCNVLDNN